MSHGHHYKHEPLLYLSVVQWCHQEPYVGLGFAFHRLLYSSHWWLLTAVCSTSEAIWGNCGIWDLLAPCYMTPGCTFETALAVLYLVHMMQNVFLYSMGRDTCVWACHLLPIQHPPPLLTCFLSLLLFTSCCLMEASRAKQKFFVQKPGTTGLHLCQSGSVSEEGCMGFLAAVFRRLWVSCFFPPCPPGFTDVSKGWCHWKSNHKLLG